MNDAQELVDIRWELLNLKRDHERLRAIYARESGDHIAALEEQRQEQHDLALLRDEWEALAQKVGQQLALERKAHEAALADLRSELAATREARDEWERRSYEVLGERDQLRESKRGLAELLDEWQGEAERIDGMLRRERDLYRRSLERAEAVIAFWEAEGLRVDCQGHWSPYEQDLWREWDGRTDIDPVDGWDIPRIVWWHAHRRTR